MTRLLKHAARAALAVGLIAPAILAADGAPVWPAGAIDKQDPLVLAFYAAQCTRWADRNALAGAARETWLARCRADAAKVYPVGYAPPPVGGGE
jgi:hypothetical protein